MKLARRERDVRLLIANPPWYPAAGGWGLRAGAQPPRVVPVGSDLVPWPVDLACAAGYLAGEPGLQVHLVDSIALRESVSGFLDRLAVLRFDLVALAVSAPSLADDLDLVVQAARLRPVVVLWPGLAEGAEALLEIEGVRGVVCTEYELGLLAAAHIPEPDVYPGDPVQDLDALPLPYRDYAVHRYRLPLAGLPDGPQLAIQVGRGTDRWRSHGPIGAELSVCRRNYPRLTSLVVADPALNADADRFAALAHFLDQQDWPWAGRVEPRAETLPTAAGATALEVRVTEPPDEAARAALRSLSERGVALTLAPVVEDEAVRALAAEVGAQAIVPRPEAPPPVTFRAALEAARTELAAAPVQREPPPPATGLRVLVVGMHLPVYMPPWLVRAARELGHEGITVDPFEDPRAVRELLDCRSSDVVLVDRGLGLPPDLIERIPGRTVLYSPEVLPTLEATCPHAERRYAEFRRVAPHFDHVVLHDRHGLPFLLAEGHRNLRGVVTLPFDPQFHRDLGLSRDGGVTFIGSASEYRQEWLDGLRGAGIEVAWPQVWAEAFIQALNRAAIVLNLHFTPLPNTEQRVVEALACGAFVVTEPLTDPELFRDGEHLVVVSRETAPDVLRHYLAAPQERQRIARAGQAWVRERYSARHCLANILGLLPEAP